MILEITLFLASLGLLYTYLMSHYKFWDKYQISVAKPKYPFFGNNFEHLFSMKSPYDLFKDIYDNFPTERLEFKDKANNLVTPLLRILRRGVTKKPNSSPSGKNIRSWICLWVVGTFTFTKPNLFVRDPELVEAITIKDFTFVSNRGNRENPNATKVSMHLLNVTGDHWRSLRTKLTPTFSSGKIKGMHEQLLACGDSLVKSMESLENAGPFEAREVMSCFTTDVIATCAFGLQVDTLSDPNSAFRVFGKKNFTFTSARKLFAALRRMAGKWAKYIKFPGSLTQQDISFFSDTVHNTLEYRKKSGVVRQDFLHLMNELLEKDRELIANEKLDPNDPQIFDERTLVSNAFVFFLAGFETTATTITFVLYMLALHPEVQGKLHQEIVKASKKYNGNLTYEAINEMKYMEMVLSETLRMHSPVSALTRLVSKDYQIPGTDIVMPKNSLITIPICGFHYDPAYFPNPHNFDPERFSEENGHAITKGTYLPFGSGPRICIGARFARQEMKVAIAKMVMKYKILKCEKTQIPMRYDKKSFLTIPENGQVWLSIEPRHL